MEVARARWWTVHYRECESSVRRALSDLLRHRSHEDRRVLEAWEALAQVQLRKDTIADRILASGAPGVFWSKAYQGWIETMGHESFEVGRSLCVASILSALRHGYRHEVLGDGLETVTKWLGPEHPALATEALRRPGTSATPSAVRIVRDDDGQAETFVQLDFEDDLLEKVLDLNEPPSRFQRAVVWIFALPESHAWREDDPDARMAIRVNGDPNQEIVFHVERDLAGLVEIFPWVPFEVPLEWLIEGENLFLLHELPEPDWKEAGRAPWTYNNLTIGIDQDTDADRSWWLGAAEACCRDQEVALQQAPKPFDVDSILVNAHRAIGRRECQGELMIFLELEEH